MACNPPVANADFYIVSAGSSTLIGPFPQKVYFDVEAADSAYHALKSLAEGASEDELRLDATVVDGLIVKAEIPWLGGTREARKRLGGPVLLGTINIEEGKSMISVNSTKRALDYERHDDGPNGELHAPRRTRVAA